MKSCLNLPPRKDLIKRDLSGKPSVTSSSQRKVDICGIEKRGGGWTPLIKNWGAPLCMKT